jgi:HK97 family phage prohead protease
MSKVDEILVRRAPATKSSWNAKNRTLEVVVSTFADYRRYGFIERLSRDPADWDLSRVSSPAGVPFLSAHDSFSSDARLGRVMSVSIGKNDIRAVVKLNDSEDANALVREIEGGTPPGISFGYNVGRWMLVEDSDDGPEVRVAREITVLEVSAVSVAADAGAHIREEARMPKQAPATDPADEPVDDNVKIFGPNEKKRLVERFGLDEAFYKRHARRDEAAFRAAVLDALVDEHEQVYVSPASGDHNAGSMDNPAARCAAMAEALTHRVFPAGDLSDQARQFAGFSTTEVAHEILRRRNFSTVGMSKSEIVERALHTTSDFSLVISTVGQTVLAKSYKAVPSALKSVAHRSTAKDFKDKTTARLSGFSDLEKVNEHGEFTRGTFEEGAERYRLITYGKVFGMTRQMIINDDLGAFANVTRELGQTIARLEATVLSSLLKSNPKMSDNTAVFHADHKNLASSGAALDETSLSAARLAMGKQVGLAGELIDVVPAYLVVSLDNQTKAEKLLAAIQPTTSDDVNPFAGRLKLAVDRRLDAAPWYLVADPNLTPSLEYAYLEGVEGPEFFTKEGFDIDGVETKVRLDFGAGWIDHRGWYRNPGQ